MHYTYFDAYEQGGFEFGIDLTDAETCSHPGDCELDVDHLLTLPYIAEQLKELTNDQLAGALRGYGCWDDNELEDRVWNEKRLVWLASCDIAEEA